MISVSKNEFNQVKAHVRQRFASALKVSDTNYGKREKLSDKRQREAREGFTSFLFVLTGRPVVTLSSAGRARISLKHGLGRTKSQRSHLVAASSILPHLRLGGQGKQNAELCDR